MDGYTDIGFRVMGSERRKKTRVSQDRTAGKKKKKKRMEDDGYETTMRNYAIDPVKESHEQAYYENRCSINRLESGTVSPGPARFPLSWKLDWWGPIWKRKGRPLLSRILVSRGIWTAAAACGNSGRPRWKSQRGATRVWNETSRGKCPRFSFYGSILEWNFRTSRKF